MKAKFIEDLDGKIRIYPSEPMRILAAIHPPEATRAILEHLGLPSRGPPIAAARAEEDSSSNEPNPEYAGALES